jgi:glycosyltransferase involved in cell wall biosynthesis
MNSVSVVMPTFNSIRTIEICLKSIRDQDYGGKVEIVAADGGSTDGTLAVLKQYGCKVVAERTGNPEKAKATALRQAQGEAILFMASDNILPTRTWLKQMVNSLQKEPQAVAAYPRRYAYRKSDTSLNRYFALMGANDPVAWFMGKADRQSYLGNENQKTKLVKFTPENMPTLGDNGMLVWRDKLMKARVDERNFSHIDIFYDLVSLGMNQFVVVNHEIIHDSGESFIKFLGKRYKYMRSLYVKQIKMRRYQWVRNYRDAARIGLFIIYSFSVIGPLLTAVNGFRRKPDLAWFWHPVMSMAMVIIYGAALIL